MTELPQGWAVATIGAITEPFASMDPTGFPDQRFQYVDIGCIDNGTQTVAGAKEFLGRDAPSRARRMVRAGDTLFSTVRTYLRNVAQVPDSLDGVLTSTGISVLRPSVGIDANYLFLWVSSEAFGSEISKAQDGTMYPAVTDGDVARAAIRVPPGPEQARIVGKLSSARLKSRRAASELKRIPHLVERYKRAVLAAAFRGALTEHWRDAGAASAKLDLDPGGVDPRAAISDDIPDEWVLTSVDRVALVSGGLTKNAKRDAILTRVPYLRVANVYANELRLSDVSMIGCTVAELSKTRLVAGDLLIVEGNGSLDQIGRVAMWNDEIQGCSHQNHLIRARFGDVVTPRYALYWLLSPEGRAAIETVASSSSGLHTLSISKVEGLPIPVCGMAEQHEIVRRIETAFAWIDRLAAEAASARALIDRLDAAVLAKAFRGELVPQDPADEPASVLLERIRAARTAAPAERRGRRVKPG